MKKLRRTMLFMPGNNPGMLQNAGILGADSIILDLEDAVSLTEKDSARILVKEALKFMNYGNTEVTVRVNPLDSGFGLEDIIQIGSCRPDAIMVPKATEKYISDTSSMLLEIEEKEGFEKESIKLIPLVETAYGLENVYNIIKSSSRVTAVLLGAEDLTNDLGIKRTKQGDEILYARNKVAVACRACQVDSIDTPFTDTNDMEGLIADTEKAKSLGLTGKASINPRQIEAIHKVFAPTKAEVQHAKRVMEAMEEAKREGRGVFSLDGKMVDAPVLSRALKILELNKLM